jgi:GDP-mannose 6-dehydrogenase
MKVQRIQQGTSPIVEAGIDEMISSAHRAGLISATPDGAAAIAASQISFICVGTPGQRNGKLDLSHIRKVCADIGSALKTKESSHCIVVRSTVLPGTTQETIIPEIEAASGKVAGKDFEVCFNPEFLREGSAVTDFFNPPFTIIGTDKPAKVGIVRELYDFISGDMYEIPVPAAEMVKYSCNAFHALKIAFANEIGTICNEMGVEPQVVMDIFTSDTRLNISKAYLKPGFAFGGSCLPKDLRALTYRVRELDLKLPVLESILCSNAEHIERAAETVLSLGKRKIGVLGLSFKPGTDDLRESPMVLLVKKLISEGCDVRIWDKNVLLGKLIGSNRDFIESLIPHIGTLLQDSFESVVAHGDVLVVSTNLVQRENLIANLRDSQYLIDLGTLEQPVLKTNVAWAVGAE